MLNIDKLGKNIFKFMWHLSGKFKQRGVNKLLWIQANDYGGAVEK